MCDGGRRHAPRFRARGEEGAYQTTHVRSSTDILMIGVGDPVSERVLQRGSDQAQSGEHDRRPRHREWRSSIGSELAPEDGTHGVRLGARAWVGPRTAVVVMRLHYQ